MQKQHELPFITMLLMISFASVNAVLFTPALPAIARFFAISDSTAQQTITWFLVGYALGQLLYGPLANRFGRKPALYTGIGLQIISSLLCVFAGVIHTYFVLILGRFLLALGSGVGLKMTFTLINETHEQTAASQKISYLMIAFAITPGLSIMLGGFLISHFAWTSCFYACAIYGVILFILITQLPETKTELDLLALKFKHLVHEYAQQFKNTKLISGGLLMGSATCFVYIFASLAPFIAMNIMHMDSASYGSANLLPPIGLVLGSLASAQMLKIFKPYLIINIGVLIAMSGSVIMFIFLLMKWEIIISVFIPMMITYFGLSLIFANASTLAMSYVSDKAHGSAVMNFINMGLVTVVILGLGFITITSFLLPTMFIIISFFMIILNKLLNKNRINTSP